MLLFLRCNLTFTFAYLFSVCFFLLCIVYIWRGIPKKILCICVCLEEIKLKEVKQKIEKIGEIINLKTDQSDGKQVFKNCFVI